MQYYKLFETAASHVCTTPYTCLQCFCLQQKCLPEENLKLECTHYNVLFLNKECFEKHLLKRVFKGTKGYVTPCQHIFFCKTCYKTVRRFTPVSMKKTTRHACDKQFCTHRNTYKKKDHKCFMKHCKIAEKPDLPMLYFYDFETSEDDHGIACKSSLLNIWSSCVFSFGVFKRNILRTH